MFPYDDYLKKCYNISNDKGLALIFSTIKSDKSSLSLGGVRLRALSILGHSLFSFAIPL